MSAATRLNWGIRLFFSEFVRVSLARPSQALFLGRTVLRQMAAARLRTRWAREGLQVPPIAIFSITNRCSLRWKRQDTQRLTASDMPISWSLTTRLTLASAFFLLMASTVDAAMKASTNFVRTKPPRAEKKTTCPVVLQL